MLVEEHFLDSQRLVSIHSLHQGGYDDQKVPGRLLQSLEWNFRKPNIGLMMGWRISLSISSLMLGLIPQQYNALTTHTSTPELIFHEMNNEIF
jgi:hypothetical protein